MIPTSQPVKEHPEAPAAVSADRSKSFGAVLEDTKGADSIDTLVVSDPDSELGRLAADG